MAISALEARLLEALNDQVEGWEASGDYLEDSVVWDQVADRYADAALEDLDA